MNGLGEILVEFERHLELERELGVRLVECDRALLAAPPSGLPSPSPAMTATEKVPVKSAPETGSASRRPADPALFDYVFLHDRPLSEKGSEMVRKITAAMGGNPAENPVVDVLPPPRAKIYVVLGGLALRKFFPGVSAACGQWIRLPHAGEALVTNSPEFILRFDQSSAAVKKIKQDMWSSLKTVPQKLSAEERG